MPYVDPQSIHNPATGNVAPATWGDTIRDDLEFLIDPPAVSIFNSTAQTCTTAVDTVLTADSENYDNNAMHSTVTNTSRITCVTAGRYLFTCTVRFAGNATGYRIVRWFLNGTTQIRAGGQQAITTGPQDTVISASRTFTLAVNDFYEIQVLQNSGGNLGVTLEEFAALYLTR